MLVEAGGWVLIDARPASAFDAFAPAPPAVHAMRASLREAFDPLHRFALGGRLGSSGGL